MTRRRYIALGVLVVVALALVGGLVFWPMRTPAESPTQFVPQPWETARLSPMHAKHVGEKTIACTRCHETGTFDTTPNLATCAVGDCHAKAAANAHHGGAKAATTCLTCHVFKGNTKPAACVDCHGSTATIAPHAHHATEAATCKTCHAVHGETGARTMAADCTSCHDVRAVHGRLEVGADSGIPVALGPHRTDGAKLCASCHKPHEGKTEARARCADCHVGASTPNLIGSLVAPQIEPRGKGVAGHPSCVACHAPHDAKKSDVKPCLECHQDHRGALSAANHTSCIQCHSPHAPSEARASCTGCHADRHVLASTKVAAHADCTNCHDPHEPPASAEKVCAKCHASSIDPKHPQGKTCIGCHAPHPRTANAPIAAACSSCHTKAKDDHAFHAKGVACEQCHKPHDFALASARTGTLAINVSGAFCAGCHATEAKKVTANPGHAVCAKCHGEAHAPNAHPSCATCHREEAQTAPKGHATCNKCHDAHSGTRRTGTECVSCHADKPAALHGGLPRGCATCHRPHGPKSPATPPGCTTCHTAKLPGLHATPAHAQDCRQCHSAHRGPSSTRATCTTNCHTDRRGHQPEAAVCKGCHLFR